MLSTIRPLLSAAALLIPCGYLSAQADYYPLSVSINASDAQVPNVAHNVIDGDLNTRWSAQGQGQSLQFELNPYSLSPDRLGIAWFKGDKRRSNFSIEVSDDGINWTTVFNGQSSGTTNDLEWYEMRSSARQVRIVGFGNSQNDWNSITEVVLDGIDGRDFDGFDGYVFLNGVSSDDGNKAENARDGSLDTRWSARGRNQTIDFLADFETPLPCVAIAWFNGDKRKAEFEVEVAGRARGLFSSGKTKLPEAYFTFINDASDSYTIRGFGNSQNDWNSITEVFFPSNTCRDVYELELASIEVNSAKATNPAGLALDDSLATRWESNSNTGSYTAKFSTLELVQNIELQTNSAPSKIKLSGVYRNSGYLDIGYTRTVINGIVRLQLTHPVLTSALRIEGLTDISDLKIFGRN